MVDHIRGIAHMGQFTNTPDALKVRQSAGILQYWVLCSLLVKASLCQCQEAETTLMAANVS